MRRVLFMFAAIAAMMFTGCNKEDDNNDNGGGDGERTPLYGAWEATANYTDDGTQWVLNHTYKEGDYIWTFTDTKVRVVDKVDLDNPMNGQNNPYILKDDKTLIISGFMTWNIPLITSTELELVSISSKRIKTVFKRIK